MAALESNMPFIFSKPSATNIWGCSSAIHPVTDMPVQPASFRKSQKFVIGQRNLWSKPPVWNRVPVGYPKWNTRLTYGILRASLKRERFDSATESWLNSAFHNHMLRDGQLSSQELQPFWNCRLLRQIADLLNPVIREYFHLYISDSQNPIQLEKWKQETPDACVWPKRKSVTLRS